MSADDACLLTPQDRGLESVSISLHQSLNLVIYVCDTFYYQQKVLLSRSLPFFTDASM